MQRQNKHKEKRSKINVSKFIYLYNIALCVRMWTLICLSYLEIVATMYEHKKEEEIHFHFIPECETVRKMRNKEREIVYCGVYD